MYEIDKIASAAMKGTSFVKLGFKATKRTSQEIGPSQRGSAAVQHREGTNCETSHWRCHVDFPWQRASLRPPDGTNSPGLLPAFCGLRSALTSPNRMMLMGT
jgi:hypothetical protein